MHAYIHFFRKECGGKGKWIDQEGWWSQEYGLLEALISKINSRKQESSSRREGHLLGL